MIDRALTSLLLLFMTTLLVALPACRPGARSGGGPAGSASVSAEPAPVAPVAPLSSSARTEDERNTIAVFREAAPSTVFVTQTRVVVDYLAGVAEEVPAGSGSGFVWDTVGHIVTNFHVVQGAQALTVTFRDQQTFEGTRIGGLKARTTQSTTQP